ncbi:hypothetical protein [Shewanella sp.]|uniref:hypothetical protein n=1 Tax=Shewanella sp. TaxID=50422 RepID=UPI0040472B82
MAKSNETIEFLSYNAIAQTMTGTFTPDIVYLQPPTTDSSPGKQTLLKIRGNVLIEQNLSSASNDQWRFDIVLDRAPAGAVLNVAQAYGVANPRITRPLNYDQIKRYKLLYSRKGMFNEFVKTSSMMNINVKLGLVAEANNNTPSQANIMKNAVYILFWSNATTNKPNFTYNLDIVSRTT